MQPYNSVRLEREEKTRKIKEKWNQIPKFYTNYKIQEGLRSDMMRFIFEHLNKSICLKCVYRLILVLEYKILRETIELKIEVVLDATDT